jgi:hypothetical protein
VVEALRSRVSRPQKNDATGCHVGARRYCLGTIVRGSPGERLKNGDLTVTQENAALWIQVAAVVAAIATSIVAVVLGVADRRNAREIAAKDRRFQHAQRELELLQRLLENYNRGGSTDPEESQRMGSEALSLVGMVGEQRLPQQWEEMVSSDEHLEGLLQDPEMPDWKKEAIYVQLAVNRVRRELHELT